MGIETRAWVALAAYVVALGAAFGWRTVRSLRETGDAGFRGFSGSSVLTAWVAAPECDIYLITV